jgi:hypothetical protein
MFLPPTTQHGKQVSSRERSLVVVVVVVVEEGEEETGVKDFLFGA